MTGDEDAVGGVDPDLFNRLVVEKTLQRTEAGESGENLPSGRRLVIERGNRATERPLAISPHLVAHEAVDELWFSADIDALTAHALAHLLGDEGEGGGHAAIVRDTSTTCRGCPQPLTDRFDRSAANRVRTSERVSMVEPLWLKALLAQNQVSQGTEFYPGPLR